MKTVQTAEHIFIIGLKGVAMAGIMTILQQMGKKVSGSDTTEVQITDQMLGNSSMQIYDLQSQLPEDIDLVIYSAAHGGSHSSQVKEAMEKKISVLHQAQVISSVSEMFDRSVAICGCHGKTGTTALTVFALLQLGLPVSWLVGTSSFFGVDESGATVGYAGAHFDPESSLFVYECDEYAVSPPQDLTPKLVFYSPTHAVCTNIDFDHPDVYRDLEHTRSVFESFFKRCGWVYECNSRSIDENKRGVYALIDQLDNEGVFEKHIPRENIENVVKRFGGAKRRLENYGEYGGIIYMDDYGHHPAEIEATINVLRSKYPDRRIVVLFQSHTYSRTQALKNEFIDALSKADLVYLDQVFPSAREKPEVNKISSLDLETLARQKGHVHIHSCFSRDDLLAKAKSSIKSGDLVLTLGAGDIYKAIQLLQSV
ncbi:MAG: cyanophycin synthetase [Candidatus Roizmanbacteria bacterium]